MTPLALLLAIGFGFTMGMFATLLVVRVRGAELEPSPSRGGYRPRNPGYPPGYKPKPPKGARSGVRPPKPRKVIVEHRFSREAIGEPSTPEPEFTPRGGS